MKRLVMLMLSTTLLSASALAANPKTYQVTGPVLEVSKDSIVVQKGNDRWEIALDSNTQLPQDVKPGNKVTIAYSMTAQKIESKETAATKQGASK